jgi:hypothetical protein
VIAQALAQAKLINISGTGDAAGQATSQIAQVIQTVMATQLIAKSGLLDGNGETENKIIG